MFEQVGFLFFFFNLSIFVPQSQPKTNYPVHEIETKRHIPLLLLPMKCETRKIIHNNNKTYYYFT